MPDKNEEYYLEVIVFQVEDQLFKVPRHLFVKLSQVFRDMFELPVPEGVEADGSSDKQPLVLEGIEKKDFVPLLRCLYPLQFPVNPSMNFTLKEWQSVLKLTSLYEMTQVKKFAIEKMNTLLITLPALQIHLAKTYDIREWLAPGFLRLAHRIKPLDEEDAGLVGLSDSFKICALREKGKRCDRCGSCGVGLKEIGDTFGIRDSDLPGVTVSGCTETCVCLESPELEARSDIWTYRDTTKEKKKKLARKIDSDWGL
ncbi:hypothetical protein F5887DRAFT_218845 [Amanita rubescens]|nr:hypothetical protein F5887DRAFT_1162678 [Amanita rubescens]KAF8333742.1 hypothetical protein F5887DRAFT_1286208 [Amanita rubescens]KAF8345181.1 hypothetical protein F5887DRAFT_218845 [Amanita rubescens]